MVLLVLIFIVIVSILLVLIVLVQNSKGGGLTANFAATTQVMGVKRTSDLLEKITWGFAISLFVLCIASSSLISSRKGDSQESKIDNQIKKTTESKKVPDIHLPNQKK